MADAGVVTEEETAAGELCGEFGQRDLVGGCAEASQSGRGGGVGFAGDDEEVCVVVGSEPRAEGNPARERPIFFRRSAARVNRDGARRGRETPPYSEQVEMSFRREAEWPKGFAVVRGGGSACGQSGCGNKNLGGVKREVPVQFSVGIGPKIENEVEGGEFSRKLGWERLVAVERGPARLVLGMHGVEQARGVAERGGGGVAGEFDSRGRKFFPQ